MVSVGGDPMIQRMLIAVDDSPAALAAAQFGVRLAASIGAAVRVVTIVTDEEIVGRLHSVSGTGGFESHETEVAVLHHVAALAESAGVAVQTARLEGEVAARILQEVRSWSADLVVMGRSGRVGFGQPYIGNHTRHVLEFADVAVLVVPASADGP